MPHTQTSSASLAASVCLCNENPEAFIALHVTLIATHAPDDAHESLLVKESSKPRSWTNTSAPSNPQLAPPKATASMTVFCSRSAMKTSPTVASLSRYSFATKLACRASISDASRNSIFIGYLLAKM